MMCLLSDGVLCVNLLLILTLVLILCLPIFSSLKKYLSQVMGYPVILFCLFYNQIQAASQSKKGLYFPILEIFFPNLRILLGFIPKFKRQRLYPQKGNKITDITHVFSPINICQVLRKLFHHEADTSQGTRQVLMQCNKYV